MKYCFNYNRRSQVLTELDEINIKFDPDAVDVLFDYILEHRHQKINARIEDINHIFDYNLLESFVDFKDLHKDVDFSIILPKYDLNLAQVFTQKGIHFFFDTVVRDWETFYTFLDAGVSDIYLVEQMMFEIKEAAEAAHQKGIKIRTFPNIAQRRYDVYSSIKSFFIRPEDVYLYEGLVDVMDLYTIEELNQDVIFQVYKYDKIWWGPIKEIIVGLDSDIDGKYIIPRFGERRLTCERKCFKGKSCDVCQVVVEISKKLEQAGILINMEKEQNKEDNKDG